MLRTSALTVTLILVAVMTTGVVAVYAAEITHLSAVMTINTGQATVAEASGSKVFTVIVGSSGFNGSSNALNLEVAQGQEIVIIFVYGDLNINNAHQILIDGYNLQTAVLDKTNPTVTVKFVAGNEGTFLIHCIIPCVGMENLQNAWLIVKPSAGIHVGTTVILQGLQLDGRLLNIMARVTDKTGSPLPGLIVSFYVSTDFGMMKVGDNVTDTEGVARLVYPLTSLRNMTVNAYFPGSGVYESGNATASFAPSNPGTIFVSVGGETSPHPSGEGGFFDVRLVGLPTEIEAVIVPMVLIVVFSVWSTFAYVIGLVLKIRRLNSKKNGGG